jgi:predicted PhzF superfamily epimerase YddE/YHI9
MYGAAPGHTAVGGIAEVHSLQDVPAEQTRAVAESFLARHPERSHTTVFVAGEAGRYVVESYSPGGARIRFCGHGALAAAWVVLNGNEAAADELECINADRSWQARRSADATADIVLSYERPRPTECPVPDFAEACLGVRPVAAAKTGTAADYLILELADADAVRKLQPDYISLAEATRRAVIVTARTLLDSAPACVFRYFAPQYGNPEDAATGSAAVQLAAYWSPRLRSAQFTALQLSQEGALLSLGCSGGKVELAARVGYR